MIAMSCSMRFARAFAPLLTEYPSLATRLYNLTGPSGRPRVRATRAFESLTSWVELSGDHDLGLKAGQLLTFGSGGALEFAMHSAGSIREAVAVAQRYSRLFSDTLRPGLGIEDGRAVIRLTHQMPAPRVVRDFTLSAWFNNHLRDQLPENADLEVWFSYPQPLALEAHRRAFGPAKLRFRMETDAFVFGVEHLDRELPSSDPLLHARHVAVLDILSAQLSELPKLAYLVHQIVAHNPDLGTLKATDVARELQISRRTLVRRLGAAGTTFTAQKADWRRQLALKLVVEPNVPLPKIAKTLGFSHVQGFHRAFKRWTGQTPIEYRSGGRER